MKFLNPEILWLIPALSPVIYFFYRRNSLFSFMLRVLAMSAFISALAEPVSDKSSTTNKAVALFDLSNSIPVQAKIEMLKKLSLYAKDQNTEIDTFGFADSLSTGSVVFGSNYEPNLESLSDKLNRNKTNIYESIQTAASRTGSGSVLLFSDGNESEAIGTIASSVAIYPVTIDNSYFIKKGLSFSDFKTSSTIKSGDKAKLNIVIRNNSNSEQVENLSILVDGKELETKQIRLKPLSQKLISFESEELKGGKHKVTAKLKNEEIHRWVTAHEKSKTLLLSGDADDEKVLATLIRLKGYKLESAIAGVHSIPEDLSSYSSIIFNNIAKSQLPQGFLKKLKVFTSLGGGILMLGGNRSFGLGGYINSELEEISPLKFTPPQSEKRRLINAIALVMDKSGSMAEQDKIVAAKKAALSSIESLKDEDYISVIGFDFAPFVIIDLQKVAIVKQTAEARLRNLTAVGKTNLLPALSAARQKLLNCPASRKHIIVLSDGKFPLESDEYVDEINKLRQGGISVSAVALGVEADVPFMKLLARYGKGAFYQTIDANTLPEIFVEDIKVSTNENSLNEQTNFQVGIGPSGLISTSIDKYRPLRGFVETLPKPSSALELITKSKNQPFPILSSWNYGKGKVIAFTSDANGRWSSPWLSSEYFSIFWTELLQKIQPTENQKDIDFDLRYKVEGNKLKLDLSLFEKDSSVSGFINNKKENLSFTQVAKGKYQSEISLKETGDYFFDLKVGETKLPEIGISIDELGETSTRGLNYEYLLKLAKETGGEINPEKIAIKQFKNTETKPLYLPLIVIGFFLILLEAFIRESRSTKS